MFDIKPATHFQRSLGEGASKDCRGFAIIKKNTWLNVFQIEMLISNRIRMLKIGSQ